MKKILAMIIIIIILFVISFSVVQATNEENLVDGIMPISGALEGEDIPKKEARVGEAENSNIIEEALMAGNDALEENSEWNSYTTIIAVVAGVIIILAAGFVIYKFVVKK